MMQSYWSVMPGLVPGIHESRHRLRLRSVDGRTKSGHDKQVIWCLHLEILADVPTRTGELAARRAPVVLLCKIDRRSAQAATQLLAAGVRNVAVLRGGTDGWHQQGLALEKPDD
jgi:rhodanese-related sulfurtransferase